MNKCIVCIHIIEHNEIDLVIILYKIKGTLWLLNKKNNIYYRRYGSVNILKDDTLFLFK